MYKLKKKPTLYPYLVMNHKNTETSSKQDILKLVEIFILVDDFYQGMTYYTQHHWLNNYSLLYRF